MQGSGWRCLLKARKIRLWGLIRLFFVFNVFCLRFLSKRESLNWEQRTKKEVVSIPAMKLSSFFLTLAGYWQNNRFQLIFSTISIWYETLWEAKVFFFEWTSLFIAWNNDKIPLFLLLRFWSMVEGLFFANFALFLLFVDVNEFPLGDNPGYKLSFKVNWN